METRKIFVGSQLTIDELRDNKAINIEQQIALDVMNELNHTIAYFGVNGYFLFSK